MATSWAPEDKVVKGCIAFVLWWLLAVFPAFPLLPIGRTAGSLVGASLMVLFGVITPEAAFAAIDLPILGLLFATMVISVYLERAKAFEYLAQALSWKTQGATDLLIRVCILAAFSSALFTNDSTCVVLTGFVLKLCAHSHLSPEPFLVALATSSNIGSALTPIGNPQNLVIAVQGKLGFWQFVLGILPAVVIGMVCNIVGLLLVYGRSLSLPSLPGEQLDRGYGAEEEEAGTKEALLMPSLSFNVEGGERRRRDSNPWLTIEYVIKHKERLLKVAGFVFLVGVWLVGATMHTFEAGVGLPWTAITAALLLTVVDFEDATKTLDKVSYSILVFFSGMFITVEGFNSVGIPAQMWLAVEPYSRIDTRGGKVVLSLVVTFLSNVASNVPTVLLLGPRVAASAIATKGARPDKAWLILAWVSTVAGNLTLVGSAANIIVCEKARTDPLASYDLTFWKHLKYGFMSTLIIIFVGLFFIDIF
jgi:Na+/H+ antiporter NhaD/arsenite permease-like protein